jgi:hypothetical protein
MVSTTEFVAGLSRITEPDGLPLWFATQTAPGVVAMPIGLMPTGIVAMIDAPGGGSSERLAADAVAASAAVASPAAAASAATLIAHPYGLIPFSAFRMLRTPLLTGA